MTSKLTDQRLADIYAECEERDPAIVEIRAMIAELQERRKAGRDSEPVADVVAWSHPTEERTCDIRWRRHDVEPGPLYRHAQQPVVETVSFDDLRDAVAEMSGGLPMEWGWPDLSKGHQAVPFINFNSLSRIVEKFRVNPQPAPITPEILPCSVELKPGLILGKGCKTATLLMALQSRADYHTEIDAMTPEERAEHDASIEAFRAMLAADPQEVK